MPETSYSTFELQIEQPSGLKPGETYWSNVGLKEATLERALHWLKADFKVFKNGPVKHRVVKTTYYKPTEEVVA